MNRIQIVAADYEQAVFRLALEAGYEACRAQEAYDAGADNIMGIVAGEYTAIEAVLKKAWHEIAEISHKSREAAEVAA